MDVAVQILHFPKTIQHQEAYIRDVGTRSESIANSSRVVIVIRICVFTSFCPEICDIFLCI